MKRVAYLLMVITLFCFTMVYQLTHTEELTAAAIKDSSEVGILNVVAAPRDKSSSGWEFIRGTVTTGADRFVTLYCPVGKLAVNGGFVAIAASGRERLVTAPAPSLSGDGWEFEGSPGLVIDGWVICVSL